jgi:two-component sensor histidine kinase
MIGVNLDVTEQRLAESRQALLMREVDHRAKNVLAMVQSIVRLSRTADPARFADAIEGRIAALARAHDLLAVDQWTTGGLRELLDGELAPYFIADRVVLDGPTVVLRAEAVQPLAMAVHELTTNAAKYGVLSGPVGRVDLNWAITSDLGQGTLRLIWKEVGGPPLAGPPPRRGFGSRLMDEIVRSQLGGTIDVRWESRGLCCVIALPAARLHHAETTRQTAGMAPFLPLKAAPSPTLTGLRVVVAEHDAVLALDLARTLRALGCEVVGVAATVDEAQHLTGGTGAAADVVVLDVTLGGQPSFPLADALLATGMPVVFTTAYGDLPDGRGAGDGRSVLLHKPVGTDDLAGALARVVRPKVDTDPLRTTDGDVASGTSG